MPIERDYVLLKKIIDYCEQIYEAHAMFMGSKDEFLLLRPYQNAIALPLMQIGELASRLSDELKSMHPEIPWRGIRGFRNVVAHEYENADREVIWDSSFADVYRLREFAMSVLEDCERESL